MAKTDPQSTARSIGKLGGAADCLKVADARSLAAEWRGMQERASRQAAELTALAAKASKMAQDAECLAAALESWLETCRKQQGIPEPAKLD